MIFWADDRTYHIKLRTHALTRTVQSNQLATEKVLARRNALGDRDSLDALVGDEAVDAPFRAVEGILVDLVNHISLAVP